MFIRRKFFTSLSSVWLSTHIRFIVALQCLKYLFHPQSSVSNVLHTYYNIKSTYPTFLVRANLSTPDVNCIVFHPLVCVTFIQPKLKLLRHVWCLCHWKYIRISIIIVVSIVNFIFISDVEPWTCHPKYTKQSTKLINCINQLLQQTTINL